MGPAEESGAMGRRGTKEQRAPSSPETQSNGHPTGAEGMSITQKEERSQRAVCMRSVRIGFQPFLHINV